MRRFLRITALLVISCLVTQTISSELVRTPISSKGFDKQAKRWTFQLGPTTVWADLIDSTNIAADYNAIDQLIKSGTLLAQINGSIAEIGKSDGKGGISVLIRTPIIPQIQISEVKGGTFRSAQPPRDITLSDYVMSRTPVTQELYELITGNNPSAAKGQADSAKRPVESVTYLDAIRFCNLLSRLSGLTQVYTLVNLDPTNGGRKKVDFNYGIGVFEDRSKNGWRLPSSAEFEYAARGGQASKGYRYSGADDVDLVAWMATNSGGKTHPVGTKKPNELGIFDLSGNVFQFCSDWGIGTGNYPVTDPIARVLNIHSGGEGRQIRGGSFRSLASGAELETKVWLPFPTNPNTFTKPHPFTQFVPKTNRFAEGSGPSFYAFADDLGIRLVRRTQPGLPQPLVSTIPDSYIQ